MGCAIWKSSNEKGGRECVMAPIMQSFRYKDWLISMGGFLCFGCKVPKENEMGWSESSEFSWANVEEQVLSLLGNECPQRAGWPSAVWDS